MKLFIAFYSLACIFICTSCVRSQNIPYGKFTIKMEISIPSLPSGPQVPGGEYIYFGKYLFEMDSKIHIVEKGPSLKNFLTPIYYVIDTANKTFYVSSCLCDSAKISKARPLAEKGSGFSFTDGPSTLYTRLSTGDYNVRDSTENGEKFKLINFLEVDTSKHENKLYEITVSEKPEKYPLFSFNDLSEKMLRGKIIAIKITNFIDHSSARVSISATKALSDEELEQTKSVIKKIELKS